MAYVTIMDACLDGKHDECTGRENTPEQPEPNFDGSLPGFSLVCGGGICICECQHGSAQKVTHPDMKWINEVRERAIESRTRRNAIS